MVMGVSLGTAFAIRVAKKCNQISYLMILAPFGDFREHMDRWQSHRYFGKLARSQPTSVEESILVLNYMDSAANI